MDTFEIVVLSIAIILLIVVLATFTYFLRNVAKTTEWPPIVSPCPDSWSIETYFDSDVSRNICVDTNNLIDPKCKSFTPGASWDAGATDMSLNQTNDDYTTENAWLVYQDSNKDYLYSGYDDDGKIHYTDSDFISEYTFDISENGATTYQDQDLNDKLEDNLDSVYTITDNTKVSFELSDASELSKDQLKSKKRAWAKNCNVSWDGITNST
tara:strand:+ start:1309 stop:1941 length:633 start_codon:yes stop_codon:yes gene_type:complete